MTRTDLINKLKITKRPCIRRFQKGYSGVPNHATSLLGSGRFTHNPCQATSMPDATKTAFTKSTVDGVYTPYVAQSVKSATTVAVLDK